MSDVTTMGARKVDLSKGTHSTKLASEWARRPDDERFVTLDELERAVRARRDRSSTEIVELGDLRFSPEDQIDEIKVDLPQGESRMTNWSFGQLCSQLGAPANFLRRLPPKLVAANLQTLAIMQDGQGQAYVEDTGEVATLRALTGSNYGRIHDADVVEQVQRIARSGAWKVPGVLDWRTGRYDPHTKVTKATTTLFASDRDVFIFLCDDTHPIEVGRTRDGDPDLMFRGFVVTNSEVGAAVFRLTTMYLRAVCCNRILWGVENVQEISIRHNSRAPERFYDEVMPGLDQYAGLDAKRLVEGVEAAKTPRIAQGEEEQINFLVDLGFSRKVAKEVIGTGEALEGHPPSTPWDFAQGLTAYAQTVPYQDKRFEIEAAAGRILDRAIR